MSYILEALKRAERERAVGKAPAATDIASMPVSLAPEPDRSRWLIRILIALLLLAITVIAVLGRAVTRVGHGSQSVATFAPTAAPTKAIATSSVASAATADTNPAAPVGAAISSLDDVAPLSKSGKDDSQAALRVQEPEPAQALAAEQAPTESDGAASSSADTSAAQPADTEQQQPEAIPASAPTEPAAAAVPASRALPTQLRQMPEAFQAQFPTFTVGVHAYDPDPKHRFTIIDNRSYREGDTLPQGPRIEAIVPEGIVFDWNGQRVLYAIQ
jgi:general secretion pathway protein B